MHVWQIAYHETQHTGDIRCSRVHRECNEVAKTRIACVYIIREDVINSALQFRAPQEPYAEDQHQIIYVHVNETQYQISPT